MTRTDLQDCVVNALKELGGKGSIIEIAKIIDNTHRKELKSSGDLYYTWHYDMRWAATQLRRQNIMKPAVRPYNGIWELR